MFGFAPNIVFLRVNGRHDAEKSRLTCATVSAIEAFARNPSQTGRALELRLPGACY